MEHLEFTSYITIDKHSGVDRSSKDLGCAVVLGVAGKLGGNCEQSYHIWLEFKVFEAEVIASFLLHRFF